ncbi:metalloprotease family protein [Ramlibacter sp. MMS24-I3-19]|uniref:metalloprotease family protein n=1 Tax=Ramlibacter sp. MMS24-I3-19 TaxID=3416606 RepID=UPI003CFEF91F
MHSISMLRGSVFGLLLAVLLYLGTKVVYWLVWRQHLHADHFPGGKFALLSSAIMGVVVHECLHFVAARIVTRGMPVSVSMGFRLSRLLPYVKIAGVMSVWQYRVVAATPFIVLGLLPAAAALLAASPAVSLFSALMMALAASDLLVLIAMRSLSSHDLVEDDPERIGCKRA